MSNHYVVALLAPQPVQPPQRPQAQALEVRLAEAEIDRTDRPALRLPRTGAPTQERRGHLETFGGQALDDLFGQIGGIDVVSILQLQHLDLAAHALSPSHRRTALRA
ncbi:hypothetical protein D3C86_1638990 [compost metagenome]